MSLRIVIGVIDDEAMTIWSDAIENYQNIKPIRCDITEMLVSPKLDAVLVPGRFAHEKYGKRPRPGRAELIKSESRDGLPRWLITKLPFQGRLVQRLASDGTMIEVVMSGNYVIEPDMESYFVLSKAFEEIAKGNQNLGANIRSFGFHADLIHSRYADKRKEAKNAVRACVEFINSVTPKTA